MRIGIRTFGALRTIGAAAGALLALGGVTSAAHAYLVPAYITSAVEEPPRPDRDRQRDADR